MHVHKAGANPVANPPAPRSTQAPPTAKSGPPPAAPKTDADGDHDGDKGRTVDARA